MLSNRSPICILKVIFILNLGLFFFNLFYTFTHQPIASDDYNYYNLTWFRSAFNYSINTAVPRLCIVTRTYGPHIRYLPVFVLSLYHANLENDRIFVINTDNRTDIQLLLQTINLINNLVSRVDYVTLIDLDTNLTKNEYGYQITDRALAYLYDNHTKPAAASVCQYVTFTNGDNFYSRSFGQKILPHMKAGKDIIAWNFISHHSWPALKETSDYMNSTVPRIIDDGSNKCINVSLRVAGVDLGAVAYRLEFLKQHKLYFCSPDGSCSFAADGFFIEKAAKLTIKSVLSNKRFLYISEF